MAKTESTIPLEGTLHPQFAWYGIWVFLSRCLATAAFDYRIFGVENVPEEGGVILAPNHVSFLDPWLVGLGQRRDPFYLARETLFRFKPFGAFIWSVNARPVARGSQAARQGLERALEVLAAERMLVFFPEGTRSEDGALQPLKRGVQLVARRSGCPAVPIWVDGAFDVWPRRRILPRSGPIRVMVGKPIWCEGTQARFEKATDESPKKSGVARSPVDDRPVHQDSVSFQSVSFLGALDDAYRDLQDEARRLRQAPRFAR